MKELVFSPRAQSDLNEIWNFTTHHWDADQADNYIRRLVAACEDLARGHRFSRPADNVRLGYRKCAIESHVVYFKETDHLVDVIRILHQSMDSFRHLG